MSHLENLARKLTQSVKPIDDLLGFHLRLAMMELRRSFLIHVGGGDIRAGLATLLQLIAGNPGASQTDVSRAMHVDKASLVSLLDEAESAGWLKRVRSKEDRRRHELRLTALGKATAMELRNQTLGHEKKYKEQFTREELGQLVEFLKRIYD